MRPATWGAARSALPALGLALVVTAAPMPSREVAPEPLQAPLAHARVEVWKAARELRLYSGPDLVRTWRVGTPVVIHP